MFCVTLIGLGLLEQKYVDVQTPVPILCIIQHIANYAGWPNQK